MRRVVMAEIDAARGGAAKQSLREALLTGLPFGDRMVLQRRKDIHVWGTGEAGCTVEVRLGSDATQRGTVALDGTWTVSLPPREAAHGLRMVITDGRNVVEFCDVAVGEVWIAGGQSNMEYFLAFDRDRRHVLDGLMNADIRYFDTPRASYDGQWDDRDYSRFGFWRASTREDLPYFSAVAYYFAVELQASLDVPVGIVGCNWGGTPACAWMGEDYLADGPGRVWIDEHRAALVDVDVERVSAEYRADPMSATTDPLKTSILTLLLNPGFPRLAQKALLAVAGERLRNVVVGPLHPYRPTGLHETMLKRVAPYSARGVIWYQGESDAPHADIYGSVFESLIHCWRDLWRDELPFLFVQLAPFGEWLGSTGEAYPRVRQQQQSVADTVPGTWMASSSDSGLQWDVHPKRKKSIGSRLALLARRHVHGQDILADAPRPVTVLPTHSGIEIRMSDADGLVLRRGPLPIEVVSPAGRPLPITRVAVESDRLVLEGSFPAGSTIRFAWTGYYEVGLVNGAGIPATPFYLEVPEGPRS